MTPLNKSSMEKEVTAFIEKFIGDAKKDPIAATKSVLTKDQIARLMVATRSETEEEAIEKASLMFAIFPSEFDIIPSCKGSKCIVELHAKGEDKGTNIVYFFEKIDGAWIVYIADLPQ